MSFGFGVGDFLAVLKLANKLRRDFIGAPNQVQDVCDQVRNLSIVLSDAEITVSGCELTKAQQNDLAEILSSCQAVLQDLEQVLGKFSTIPSTSDPSFGTRVRRVWKQLNWEPGEMRELRERTVSVVSLLHAYLGGISSRAVRATRKGVDRLNAREDDKTRTEILNWLTLTDYATQQHDFISRQQEGTGRWLLDSTEYQTWIAPSLDQRTLFCPGMPGAGKTILTAMVIDDLMTRFATELASSDIGIAYIYFNFRRHDQQKLEDVIRSILRQLCQSLPSVTPFLTSLWEKHKQNNTRPTAPEITQGLEEVVKTYPNRVFIVVDAVDESSTDDGTRAGFLGQLFRLQEKSITPLRIFATSRYMPDIMDTLRSRPSTARIDIRASHQDIERYVDGNIDKLLPFVKRNVVLQREIKNVISEVVDGMFLLAQVYFNSLVDKTTPKAVRAALDNFRKRFSGSSEASKVKTLRRAYDDAMDRIVGQLPGFKDLALKALSWISCATRPLETIELQHALAVEIGTSELDHDNVPDVEDILGACAGLVTVDAESHIIRLVHYTTQEYLEDTRSQWFPDAEDYITRISATYLSFRAFSSGPCQTEVELQQRTQEHVLYRLVASSFSHHASEASRIWPEVIDFLQNKPTARAAYQFCVYENNCRKSRVARQSWLRTVQLAAYFGLVDIVDFFLRSGYDPNRGTKLEGCEKDSGISHQDPLTASLATTPGKRRPVVSHWLAFTVFSQSPLHVASAWGHEVVVRLLLEQPGIDVNAIDSQGSTPLHEAASMGHVTIVQLLLSCPDVEVDAPNDLGFSPLHLAVLFRNTAVMEALLSSGAFDVDSDGDGFVDSSILDGAIRAGFTEGVELLLSRPEADIINRTDAEGNTLLHHAAMSGQAGVARFLLSKPGIDVDARNNKGSTPLHLAAQRGDFESLDVMELLLNTPGIEMHAVDNKGETVVSIAAEFSPTHTVTRLLRRWNAEESERWHYSVFMALRAAARRKKMETINMLLTRLRIDRAAAGNVGRPRHWRRRSVAF